MKEYNYPMQEILTYSELLYLFAERYAPEAALLQNKEELPNGKKLNVTRLGNLLAEAAFAHLYYKEQINLEYEAKKLLGFIPKKVVVATRKIEGTESASLEGKILALANGLDIHSILYKLIGEECTVPWSVITGIVKESLTAKGFLIKEEISKKIIVKFVTYKYHVNPAKTYAFETEIGKMNSQMKEFAKLDFYKDLVRAIDSGIRAQIEQPDTD